MEVPDYFKKHICSQILVFFILYELVVVGIGIWVYDPMLETNIKQKPKTHDTPIESKVNYAHLVNYISKEYTVKASLAKDIVLTVYDQTAYSDFPSASLVLAVIAVESSFRVDVESHKGALGLMQLMPVHDPDTEVQSNIASGIWVLKMYRLKVPTDDDALHAYNLGIGAFNKGKRNYNYVDKVLTKKQDFVRF